MGYFFQGHYHLHLNVSTRDLFSANLSSLLLEFAQSTLLENNGNRKASRGSPIPCRDGLDLVHCLHNAFSMAL